MNYYYIKQLFTAYKYIYHCYIADRAHFYVWPRFWLNKSIKTPNFNHWSIVCRWAWWYFGIQKKDIKKKQDEHIHEE